jgi:hypothetical protein
VTDAIRDGKVSREERTLFEGGANDDRIQQEQDRLRAAVTANHKRDEADEPPTTATAYHALESTIADERSLLGALDAERTSIESGAPDAADDYQVLREEAQPWIDQFNENGGQYYQGNDLMGDDWDEATVDFDRLAQRFTERPDLLDDFPRVQGKHDEDIGDDPDAHIADVAEDDPQLAEQIRLRHEAALHLQSIMERYQVASGGIDASRERVDAITEEQQELREDIEDDEQLLAQSTADLTPTPVVRPPRDLTEVEAQFPSNEAPEPEPEPTPVVRPPRDIAEVEAQFPSNTPAPEQPTAQTPTSPPVSEQVILDDEPSVTQGAPEPAATPTPDEVLDQAAADGVIDATARDRFSFNDAGELVYAAQPGDGYWQAAEHVRPPAGSDFDSHWRAIWCENSMRTRGVADDPFVAIDQEIVIPGYTLDGMSDAMAQAAAQSPTQSPTQIDPSDDAAPDDDALLDAAAQAGIIDVAARDRFSFGDTGELLYAAQPGDGYWQAAAHVRPPAGQDAGQLWQAMFRDNSLRLHGVPDEQLVLVDQQLVVPGYTRDSLLEQS